MKRALIALATLAFVISACSSDAAWQGPAPKPNPTLHGVVVEIAGPVTATSPKGESLPTAIGAELASGSKVRVGDGGKASVMLMDGAIISIDENTAYVVGTPPPQKEKATLMRGITIALNEAANISLPAKKTDAADSAPAPKATPRVRGMVKMGQVGPGAPKPQSLPFGGGAPKKRAATQKARPRLQGTYPVETAIALPETITFRWNVPISFSKPVVVLEGDGIARTTIDIPNPKKTSVAAAARGLGLKKGGSYSWYLAARGDKPGRGRSQRFPFTILSKDKEEHLARDVKRIDETAQTAEGRAFLKGQLYFNYGMNYEMVNALQPLWKTNRSPAIKKLLKLGHARMGQIEEARKYK